jgi:S1-C subfamily serine protease
MPRSANRSRTFYIFLGAGLMFAVLAGSFSLGRWSGPDGSFSSPAFSHPAFAETAPGIPLVSIADVAERSLNSVVNISSTRKVKAVTSPFMDDPLLREFFRQFGPVDPSPRRDQSLGSGVIVRPDGIVLTNNHVVANAETIRVVLSDKREYDAKVLGTDPKSDVAVIKLKNATGLKAIRMGNSDKMRLGEVVLAVGNPFGVGQTVTMGIISAKGRANMGIVDYEDSSRPTPRSTPATRAARS